MSAVQQMRDERLSETAQVRPPASRSLAGGAAEAPAAARPDDARPASDDERRGMVEESRALLSDFQRWMPPAAGAALTAQEIDELPPWIAEFVRAVTGRTRELEAKNKLQLEQIADLDAKMHALVAENEQLHKSLGDGFEGFVAHGAGLGASGLGDALGGGGGDGDAYAERERAELLLRENATMVEQLTTMNAELERTTGEATEAVTRASQLEHALRQAQAHGAQLEAATDELQRARAAAEQRFVEHSHSLSATQAQLEELREGLGETRADNERLRREAAEREKAVRELEDKAEADVEKLWARVQALSERARELQGWLASKTQEAESAHESARKLSRDLDTTRADNEGMLQVMSGMEKQLNDFAAREEQVAQVSKDAKEKVENALLARDKAVAREVQGRQELARALEARRKDADDAETTRAESHAALRDGLHAQLDEKLKEIAELGVRNTELASRNEHLARDRAHAEALRAKAAEALDDERATVEARCAELGARIAAAEDAMLAEQARWRATKRELDLLQSDKKHSDEAALRRLALEEERLRKSEALVADLQEKLRRALADAESNVRLLERAKKQHADDAGAGAKRHADELRAKDAAAEAGDKERQLLQSERDELRGQVTEQSVRHESALDSAKADKAAAVQQLELQAQEATAHLAKLAARNQELEVHVAQLSAEVANNKIALKDAQDETALYEGMFRDADHRTGELAHQLASALSEDKWLRT